MARKRSRNDSVTAASSLIIISAFAAFLLGALSKTMATVLTYSAIRCKVMIQAAEPDKYDKLIMNG